MTAVSTASAKTSAPRSPQSSPVVGTDEQCVGARRQAGEVNGEKSVVGKHVHRDERGRLDRRQIRLNVRVLVPHPSQDPVSGNRVMNGVSSTSPRAAPTVDGRPHA